MSANRYQPWQLLDQLQSEMNRLFDLRTSPWRGEESGRVVASDWVPMVDVKEEQDRWVVYADLPGVDPKSIEITMEQGVLALRGERRTEGEQNREAYKRAERPSGTFYRSFNLPDTVDAERIAARCGNGVLELTIPKKEREQPRKISVEG